MRLSQLFTHPLKSGRGVALESAIIEKEGLKYDRKWALIDKKENRVITGRDFPKLLAIHSNITDEGVNLLLDGKNLGTLPTQVDWRTASEVAFFSRSRKAVLMNNPLNNWFSDYLETKVQLIYHPTEVYNPVLEKHGGKVDDAVRLADQCPILLIGEATLEHLNSKLDIPVGMRNFRPNIVVAGSSADAEDNWKRIKIGDCEFDVSQACIRCVFTTIDPETGEKSPVGEPLKTLATYKRIPREGISFGVHLIPRKLGRIAIGDQVEVLA